MYFNRLHFNLVGFRKSSRKNKMYDAIIENKKTKKKIYIPFGDNKMMNYRDITGLNLYPHLIHNDNERRRRYKARAVNNVRSGFFSPSFFSFYYLW